MTPARDAWEAARQREAKLLRQSAKRPPLLTPEQQATNRRKNAIAKSVETARRKDRGDDHPATSDHEYTDREWEFMRAMRAYQEITGRKVPELERGALCDRRLGISEGSMSDVNPWDRAPVPIVDWFRICSAAAVIGARHDCLFSGGPKASAIFEVSDDALQVFFPDSTYDRTGPSTFTFRQPPAEPRAETWRDRAIREPMW